MSFASKDVVFLPESTAEHPDRWIAMNVFARTSLGVSADVLAYLSGRELAAGQKFVCWEIETFSNEDGLLADPSRFRRDVRAWQPLELDRAALDQKLRAHCIVVDDEAAYRARFASKKHLLDRERFGNFHQQHGQHMMLYKRADPAQWWMSQKFTADRKAVREDNLYGAVQWRFLESYFKRAIGPQTKAIDLGCGTGIYSNLMAASGADVIGIDPSDEYLTVARANAAARVRFDKADIGAPGALAAIPDASADLVFMSDALLFYFKPFYPDQHADIEVLLSEIKRLLKPGGRFVSMEPHALFYHAPWLGAADRPFTIVGEYMHKHFGIVPTFSWLVHELGRAGFAVTDLMEVGPADYYKDVDPRGYHFAREFPVWQVLELQVVAR